MTTSGREQTAWPRVGMAVAALFGGLGLAVVPAVAAEAGGLTASDWTEGYNSRIRLVAGGRVPGATSGLAAGVEIVAKPGWKTYWRNPGDAGVPPTFDWAGSDNAAAITVRYPAPQRLEDKSGVTLGYMDRVLFPVVVRPVDTGRAVRLELAIAYGICKDICVPAEATLALEVPPANATAGPPPPLIADALDRVPRARGAERAGDPRIETIDRQLGGPNPRIVIEAAVPGGAEEADAFLVTADGGFMPLAQREAASKPGRARFVVDLSRDVDLADLRSRTILVTVTGAEGASEAEIRLD